MPWRSLLRWWNWRLPVKLAAVTLVPVIFVVVLGAVVISKEVSDAHQYEVLDQRVALNGMVRDVIAAAQRERNAAAVAGAGNSSKPGDRGQYAALDNRVRALRGAVASTPNLDAVSLARWNDANFQLGRLTSMRATWRSDPDTAVAGYTDVIRALLGMGRALASGGGDRSVMEPSMALYDLDGAAEEVFGEQALVLTGITRGHMLPSEVAAIRDNEARRVADLADFQSLVDVPEQQRYQTTVAGAQVNQYGTFLRRAIDNAPVQAPQRNANNATDARHLSQVSSTPLNLTVTDWNASSDAVTSRMKQVADGLAATMRGNSAALQKSASDGAGLAAVVLFCALLIAAAAVWVIARQLLRSIRTLHAAAHDVATRQLPGVVSDIRAGREVVRQIDPVGVHTEEEVGQLARAFDAVHSEARTLAIEQASMRSDYGNVFVNLSRRSQSLVQRQLRLIERLERDEEDPDQLSTLFQLDHLATRMRRNNENLMVLSGSDSTGRGSSQQPTALGDLLRASVSEIEHYQRVLVQLPPQLLVVGYAAGDLVRLVAELLDNATAFSAPDTQVTVSTLCMAEGRLVIDIVDAGIGMREEDLHEANVRLTSGGTSDVPVSRRMGLFVVGRLAERHGMTVRLHGGSEIPGVRASIEVPSELVIFTGQSATQAGGVEQPPAIGAASVGPTLPEPAKPFGAARTNGHQRGESDAARGDTHTPAETTLTGRFQAIPVQSPGAEALAAAASSSADLFTPAGATGAEPVAGARPGASEKTPIFDEMISAWFDPTAPAARADAVQGSGSNGHQRPHWQFAADAGWQAAQEVSERTSEQRTKAGLPKRTPRARLLPGTVEERDPGTGAEPAVPATRDAQSVRDRLASFQRGLRHGREQETAAGPERAAAGGTAASDAAASDAESHPSGLPQRRPAQAKQQPDAVGTGSAATPDAGNDSRWQFAADAGWRAAHDVSDADPEEQTSAGLPRRTPKARLLPGSIAPPNGAPRNGAPAESRDASQVSATRDAQHVRSRLASLQRGIRDGRQTVGVPSGETPSAHYEENR
ncbi:MAG: nitrate- and nitrite sensing domain-containing protein [Sciscionella sp.]